jgi:hypothetical protein
MVAPNVPVLRICHFDKPQNQLDRIFSPATIRILDYPFSQEYTNLTSNLLCVGGVQIAEKEEKRARVYLKEAWEIVKDVASFICHCSYRMHLVWGDHSNQNLNKRCL